MNNLTTVKSEIHRLLKPYLDVKGLSLMQQCILIEDLATAIENRVKVFQKHNSGEYHEKATVVSAI